MEEKVIWKDIPNYEGFYQASNKGDIKSVRKNIILKPYINNSGYYRLALCINGKPKTLYTHVLIAMAFLDHRPNGHIIIVDHKDNDKLNNLSTNLQLITKRKNSSKDKKGYSSKYVGVYWDKQLNKWGASIYIDKKNVRLGYHTKEYDAHLAYQNKLKEIQSL